MGNPSAASGLDAVLAELGYEGDEGLVSNGTESGYGDREFVWREVRNEFGVDAAYFHKNKPVVYFSEFQEFDPKRLQELHRSLWNHNRAPILIVVLPNEVRVYNCFALPARDEEEFASTVPGKSSLFLEKAVRGAAAEVALGQALSEYRRRDVIAGRLAKEYPEEFSREDRIDKRLLGNLAEIRVLLHREGLKLPVANRLLGRCIFICYLADRGLLEMGLSRKDGKAFFINKLRGARDVVYSYFEALSERFNGDLFPVEDDEIVQVKSQHLERLGDFLEGTEVASGQMCFWAYDFKYVPIELISAIYEVFLKKVEDDDDETNRRDILGVHYTSLDLVDFMLEDVIPVDGDLRDYRILDPACGSGIFLVEAFRRLVFLHTRHRGKLCFKELCSILTSSIFGVDIDADAVGVAVFSCYLALLDAAGLEEGQGDFRLPNLRETNLIVSDFFDTRASFNDFRYDVVVGNPPWGRGLKGLTREFIEGKGYCVANGQIAQAFLWRVSELLSDDGIAGLLCPSMSVLFNGSEKAVKFRHEFFRRNWVTKIADFSVLRWELFRDAVAPAAAIFFRKDSEDAPKGVVTHMGFRRSPLSELLGGIVIYGDEIKSIGIGRSFEDLNIWKAALWGAPRDLLFLSDLRKRFPKLKELMATRNWKPGQGVAVGNRKNCRPDLGRMRFVPANKIEDLSVISGEDCRIGKSSFERVRNDELFHGPRVLIRKGVSRGFLHSAFFADDAVCTDSVFVIRGGVGDANYLKFVSAVISSSLSSYYHFLTSSSWGVERSVVLLKEHREFPIPFLDEDDRLFQEVVELVDVVQVKDPYPSWRTDLDKLIFEVYGLTPNEQQVLKDFVETEIDLHDSGTKSEGFGSVSDDELAEYAEAFKSVFVAMTGEASRLRFSLYERDSYYRAVSFQLVRDAEANDSAMHVKDMEELLAYLENIAFTQPVKNLYSLKNIKVYEDNRIHVVKPDERRFWTGRAGYIDADLTLDELFKIGVS